MSPRVFRYAGYRNKWQVEVVLLFYRTDVRDGMLCLEQTVALILYLSLMRGFKFQPLPRMEEFEFKLPANAAWQFGWRRAALQRSV